MSTTLSPPSHDQCDPSARRSHPHAAPQPAPPLLPADCGPLSSASASSSFSSTEASASTASELSTPVTARSSQSSSDDTPITSAGGSAIYGKVVSASAVPGPALCLPLRSPPPPPATASGSFSYGTSTAAAAAARAANLHQQQPHGASAAAQPTPPPSISPAPPLVTPIVELRHPSAPYVPPRYSPLNPASTTASVPIIAMPAPGEVTDDVDRRPKKSVKVVGLGESDSSTSELLSRLTLRSLDVLGTLGTGTFGRVLLVRLKPSLVARLESPEAALSTRLPPYFALKALNKAELVRLKQVEHVTSERAILARVNHPYVIRLIRTFQDEKCIYLLMEFVSGGEMFSYLRKAGKFPVDVTRFYIAQLVLVLEHLHAQNIVYRDIKPENLLLDPSGNLKVADFGFAKQLSAKGRTFTLCGTPEFLSPEVISGTGHGKAADWWALGVLMYEMLCGFPPYWDEHPYALYEKILKGKLAFPKHVDVVSRDLIRSLLTASLSKRLGNLAGGAADVKRHFFFHNVDWKALLRGDVPAPIVPGGRAGVAGGAEASPLVHFAKYDPPAGGTMPGLEARDEGGDDSAEEGEGGSGTVRSWKQGEWDHLFPKF